MVSQRNRSERPIIPAILPYQPWVADKYANTVVQIFVAVLILVNFVVSALEAQIRPVDGSDEAAVFKVFEWFFGIIFTVELFVNMYGQWFTPFWKEVWNVFDFVIVAISILSLCFENLPGISVLRLFRAFRVFRLFKRIKSLRIIIEASIKSVPGVSNVFVILTIIMAIWAIMGVNFFGEAWDFHIVSNGTCAAEGFEHIQDRVLCETAVRELFGSVAAQSDSRTFAPPGCVWLSASEALEFNSLNTTVPCGSAHEEGDVVQACVCKAAKPYDVSYFQSFWPAMFTLFQVWTGDSWGGIARPLVMAQGFPAYLFFITYIFANGIIMTNAVVAILIERFMGVVKEMQETDSDSESSGWSSDEDWGEDVGKGTVALERIHDSVGQGDAQAAVHHVAVHRAALCRLQPLELVDEVRLNEPLDKIFESVQSRVRDELHKTKARLQEVRELARKAKRRKCQVMASAAVRGGEDDPPAPPIDAPPSIGIGPRTRLIAPDELRRRQARDESKDESICSLDRSLDCFDRSLDRVDRSTRTGSLDARFTQSPMPPPAAEGTGHHHLPGSIDCSPNLGRPVILS